MKPIRLSRSECGAVILSEAFIDHYMPEANGEFVKVYLYLLKCAADPEGFSLARTADALLCTEGDVLRALKYWEAKGLLRLGTGAGAQLCDIALLPLQSASPESGPAPKAPAPAESSEKDPLPSKDRSEEDDGEEEIPFDDEAPAPQLPPSGEAAEKTPDPGEAPRQAMTPARVKELLENEDVSSLIYIAEQYLSRTLSSSEIDRLLYLYDGLHMGVDLIDYLIEYCVGRDKKNFSYIESVARAWQAEGIQTVADAKESANRSRKEYYQILKALGVTGRSPVAAEIALMDKWLSTFGFGMDMIEEACSRTVIQTGSGAIRYADKVLSQWNKEGVKNPQDLSGYDQKHAGRSRSRGVKSGSASRFNSFPQRKYDYSELEKKLLNQ